MLRRRDFLYVMGLSSCPPSARSTEAVPDGAAPQASAPPAQSREPAPGGAVLEATSMGMRYGKPPLKFHSFDLALRNPASAPRWMVLPSTFPYANDTKPAPGDGSVAGVQVTVLSEHPRVVLLHAVGLTSYAVQLPARGTLALRRLVIESWWDAVPAAVDLEVLVAREIRVDGAPIAERIGFATMSESGADVAALTDAGDPRVTKFWHPDEGKSPPAVIDVESRARVRVPLRRGE